MPKGQNTASSITTGMGVASGIASTIPGIGPAIGAGLGLGSQFISWILGSDKYDWKAWEKNQLAGIDREYNTSLNNATSTARKTANATIGEATNKQAMAGGVSGISNPGRLNAQTYANIAQNRDDAITSITNALEQNRSAMKSAVIRESAQGQMQEDFNAPTALTYIDNFVKSLQSPVMQEGIGAIIGGVGKGINSLFSGKTSSFSDKGYGAAFDRGTGGMAQGDGINTDIGFTGNKFNPVGPINWATPNPINQSPMVGIMRYLNRNKQPFIF